MKKILIVDDEQKNIEHIRENLEAQQEIKLFYATSVHAAIAILQKENIALLATAVHLPETDGLDLLAYMTRKFASIPCIVMLDQKDPRPWFSEHHDRGGVLYYLKKPFDFEQFTSAIHTGFKLYQMGMTSNGMDLLHFLPLMSILRKTGRLEIRSGNEQTGYLYFDKGQLLDARVNNYVGEAAVKEMIGWKEFQMTISELPAERKEKKIESDLMSLINLTWEENNTSYIHKRPVGRKISLFPSAEAPPRGRNKLETALYRQAGLLRTVKGYKGLAIVNFEGKILAADLPDNSIDFESIAEAAALMHADCSKHLSRKGLGPCNGITLHTPQGIIILRNTDVYTGGNYRFLSVMSEDGNGHFLQVQIKTIIPKILSDMAEVV